MMITLSSKFLLSIEPRCWNSVPILIARGNRLIGQKLAHWQFNYRFPIDATPLQLGVTSCRYYRGPSLPPSRCRLASRPVVDSPIRSGSDGPEFLRLQLALVEAQMPQQKARPRAAGARLCTLPGRCFNAGAWPAFTKTPALASAHARGPAAHALTQTDRKTVAPLRWTLTLDPRP